MSIAFFLPVYSIDLKSITETYMYDITYIQTIKMES